MLVRFHYVYIKLLLRLAVGTVTRLKENVNYAHATVLEIKVYYYQPLNGNILLAMNAGHDIDWSDAQVIDASPLLQQRCTLESWHIRRQPQPLNRERGMLPTVYDQLITQTSHLSS